MTPRLTSLVSSLTLGAAHPSSSFLTKSIPVMVDVVLVGETTVHNLKYPELGVHLPELHEYNNYNNAITH
jgi:hypothetical protein